MRDCLLRLQRIGLEAQPPQWPFKIEAYTERLLKSTWSDQGQSDAVVVWILLFFLVAFIIMEVIAVRSLFASVRIRAGHVPVDHDNNETALSKSTHEKLSYIDLSFLSFGKVGRDEEMGSFDLSSELCNSPLLQAHPYDPLSLSALPR
ncbi:BgTH12-04442 [Blumeria graminis f. sp. triticale]|uniref:BgTH12-04442 n=1 Tax=Blumeria graminis f. sp. triticale TaxID=1689686 RepID=A0A9W4CYS2_BLUGR|nr:BgTH12-04442 [Blumeria graminis f. sp. triticale]